MDFTQPINAKRQRARRKHPVRRWVVWGCGLLLGGVGVVAALPGVLSMGWAREAVVRRVNEVIAPATVDVKAWHLSWFGGQWMEGMVYRDEARGVAAEIRRIETGSLWALMPVGAVAAEVSVEAPKVTLSPVKPSVAVPAPPMGEAAAAETPGAKGWTLPAWAISAKLKVSEAQVCYATLPEPLLSEGALEVTLAGWAEAPEARLSARILAGRAEVEARACPLPEVDPAKPLAALREVKLALAAPCATAAVTVRGGRGPWPEGEGSLQVDLPAALARLQELAALFGQTLALPEGLVLTGGQANLVGSVKALDGAKVGLSADLKTAGLAGCYDGKALTLSPKATLRATVDPADWTASTVEDFSLALPGIAAQGRGSAEAGSLEATLRVNEVLTAFRPLLGGVAPLPRALTVNLAAQVQQARSLALTVGAQAEGQAEKMAEVEVKAEGVNLAARCFEDLRVSVVANLAEAAGLVALPAGGRVKGQLLVNAAAAGSVEAFRAKTRFAVQEAEAAVGSWHVRAPVLVSGEAEVARAVGGEVALDAVKVTLPCASAEGRARWTPGQGWPTFELTGLCRPGEALAWRKVKPGTQLPKLSGEWIYRLVGENAELGPRLKVAVRSADFRLALPDWEAVALPFTLEVQSVLGPLAVDKAPVLLERLSFGSDPLRVEAKGQYAPASDELCLEGMWTPDWAAIWALPFFESCREKGLSVSGRQEKAFHFVGPITAGVPGILNAGRATLGLGFERIGVPGLDVPGGEMKLTLADAIASLDGAFTVNGGKLCLQPRLTLSAPPYVLTLPAGSYLLKEAAITQELLDRGLCAVNPLLPGSASPKGTLSVQVEHFRLPLGEGRAPLEALEAGVSLQTAGCAFEPNGTLGTVLMLLQARDKALVVPDQHIAVQILDGVLTCSGLAVKVAGVQMTCRGTTNLLTHDLRYTLSVPLTEQLLGRHLSKRLPVGRTLEVPIFGTMEKPRVDTDPLLNLLKTSAATRLTEKVTGRLGKVLQKGAEAGSEVGGAAGDVVEEVGRAVGEGSQSAGDALGRALEKLLKKRTADP